MSFRPFQLIALFLILILPSLAFGQEISDDFEDMMDDSLGIRDTLIIGVKQSPPFFFTNENGEYSGISLHIWEIIAKEMNVHYEYQEMDFEHLLQALEEGDIDMSINPLTVTSDRIRKFSFSQPFFTSNSAIAVHMQTGKTIWAYISSFFNWKVMKIVLLLLVMIVIFGTITWLLERKKNHEDFSNNLMGIIHGIWWSAVTVTTVGYGDKSPKTMGGRLVALVWMFIGVILISAFTASITTTLTVDKLNVGIQDLNDLRTLRVGTIHSSASETFLKHNYIRSSAYHSVEDGLKALDENKIDAFVYDDPILRYYVDHLKLEDLEVLNFKFNPQYYSFSYPLNSSYESVINPVLLKELEEPSWKMILSEYGLNDF